MSKPIARYVVKKYKEWSEDAFGVQRLVLKNLVGDASDTAFGKDHGFSSIKNYEDFKQKVPIRDYEGLRPYIERIIAGEEDVLWKGLPIYFAKTSGTTSGVKYIPITKASISNHINGARDAILHYVHETGNSGFLDGKLIFLSGSPILDHKGKVPTGRLSGIVNHHVPGYLKTNQLPTYKTNCIEDWEEKVDRIIEETINEPMTLISGIPPWVQVYFDKLQAKTGKPIKDIFPDFSLFIYGGVNFEPYRTKLFNAIGKSIDSIETYPASEGFIAFQNEQNDTGLLLLINAGIFYEFIPMTEYFDENPSRLSIEEVKLGVNYALIINNNAGLWGYAIGDTVKFVSLNPHKVVVTGRVKHFISAFGEHVIAEEVEKALQNTLKRYTKSIVAEFTVAPQVNPAEGLPLHEWFIEFSNPPENLIAFENELNLQLQKLNTYYDDLIQGNILDNLKIVPLRENAFRDYMKSIGKLGGQNKLPRLSNDRVIADALSIYSIK